MTATDWLAIIGAVVAGIVTITTAIANLLVTMRNEKRAVADRELKDEKLEAIHAQVDGAAAAVKSQVDQKIAGLSTKIADLSGKRGDQAIATAAIAVAEKSAADQDLERKLKAALDEVAELKKKAGPFTGPPA